MIHVFPAHISLGMHVSWIAVQRLYVANVAIANVHCINKDQVQAKRNEAIATGLGAHS